MSKIRRDKVSYLEYTFNIFEKYGTWQISFKNPKDNNKIVKRSTKLEANSINLAIVKKDIIPSIVEFLSGKVNIDIDINYEEILLNDFSESYFEIHKNRVREHTFYRNKLYYESKVKPYFGNRKITEIKPIDLERWQNNFISKNYKKNTIQKYRSVFFSILNEAVKNEIIKTNPLSLVSSPKIEKKFEILNDEDEICPFSKEEIKTIINNSDGYLKNFIILMFSSGMRPGEIIALTWNDIDFDKKQITVNKTITNGKVGLPKTATSVRKVDMLPLAEFTLLEQLKTTKKFKYVFVNSKGTNIYSHSFIGRKFNAVLDKSNIPHRPLYNLRHTFASHLLIQGEDITWISKNLGHTDISITMKHYIKYIKENEETRLAKIKKIGENFGIDIF